VAFLTFCISVTALFLITKIVSLSCLLGILFTISSLYLLGAAYIELWILVAVLIFFAHRANISRLVKGEEPKFSFKQR
jgi:glycerol-3-phosphate acyltransferase PlsY